MTIMLNEHLWLACKIWVMAAVKQQQNTWTLDQENQRHKDVQSQGQPKRQVRGTLRRRYFCLYRI